MKAGDKLIVYYPVYAEYMAPVTLTEEMIDENGDVDYEAVEQAALEEIPGGLGICCSGYGQPWSLDLSDVQESRYISDEEGNVVDGDPDKTMGW